MMDSWRPVLKTTEWISALPDCLQNSSGQSSFQEREIVSEVSRRYSLHVSQVFGNLVSSSFLWLTASSFSHLAICWTLACPSGRETKMNQKARRWRDQKEEFKWKFNNRSIVSVSTLQELFFPLSSRLLFFFWSSISLLAEKRKWTRRPEDGEKKKKMQKNSIPNCKTTCLRRPAFSGELDPFMGVARPSRIWTDLLFLASHRLTLDLWLAKDNRFLNSKSSYGRILTAPPCRLICWLVVHPKGQTEDQTDEPEQRPGRDNSQLKIPRD